jgi:hypothetical protein
LQGERRGQESLKNNLIRRIKMLELALKQERVKYHKLKYGTEPNESKASAAAGNATQATNDNNGNDQSIKFDKGFFFWSGLLSFIESI